MKRFNILIPRDDGGVEIHPMKEWLRRNPGHLPEGTNPSDSNSHQLRALLKKQGWRVEELSEEVRLFPPLPPEPDPEDSELAFGLEAQLRDFLAYNLPNLRIGGRALRLYVDPEGRDGVEYPTAVGFIDLLAVDDVGRFVVFELKLERGPDRALGQLARYMGWVRLNLAQNGEVNGVIVARTIDARLRYAVAVVPHVTLLEYAVRFEVREAAPLTVPSGG